MSSAGNAGQRNQSLAQRVSNAGVLFCPICRKTYLKETALQKHTVKCAEKNATQTWLYKRAYPLYERWFREAKRAIPHWDTFRGSRFGQHFTSFIGWCDAMKVAAPDVYVTVMINHKLHPSVWSTPSSFKLYLQDFDSAITPEQWILATVQTIENICEERNVPTRQFYRATSPNELIHLIRIKNLYPRYLVCDPLFGAYLASMPPTVAKLIGDAIDDRFIRQNPCDPTIMAVIEHVNR